MIFFSLPTKKYSLGVLGVFAVACGKPLRVYITSSPYCATPKAGLAIAKGQTYFLQKLTAFLTNTKMR
ncbi:MULTISPECIES: hypothetical protein [Fischerella]|uniref:Uncharacterized protein n=1 Tax=Fischerella muscicola CCMEE 5323 TaxID=2019572 RepID=A0A2N6JZL9_FISMU|nr:MULTISPECIES: hypothetical protein [Fischerella]MBD2431178.1 hypothetical protein [Fischerella sp. FACHB-380]PLZ86850.1 hypothetical protein CEN44_18990 [Fischerella muscicola CCMEE 5323]